MKLLKLKSLIIALIAVTSATAIFSGSALAQTNALENSNGLKQDRLAINHDLSNINVQQRRIKSLEKQCKDERIAGIKNSPNQKDLMTAKTNLKKDKGYLKVDKSDFLRQYQAVINNHKLMVKDEKSQLMASRKKLNEDLNNGNSRALLYAQDIVNHKQILKQDEAALRHSITNRNDDLLAINKDIKSVNGQPAMVLNVQNTAVKAQNLAMK